MDGWFLWFGRNARLVALAVGSCVLISLLSIGTLVVVSQTSETIGAAHQDAFQTLTDIREQSDQLLTRLSLEGSLVCDQQTLKRLRGVLFEYRFLKEVGLINERNELYCTTSQGAIYPTLPLNTDGLVQKNGDLTKFQVPILATNSRVKTTIIQRKFIDVVVEPNILDSINSQIDVAWYRSNNSVYIAYLAEQTTSQQLTFLKSVMGSVSKGLNAVWSSHGLVITSSSGEDAITFQTVRPWGAIIAAQRGLVLVIAAFAALTALFSATATENRCRKNLKLKSRIHRLLDAKYIVCMYQPIIELGSGRVVGCEVLARLRDGDQIQLPEKFIPAVISRELTWELDAAVTKKALDELLKHIPQSVNFRIALNFFPESIKAEQIHRHFQNCLDMARYTNLILDIEITEYSMSSTVVKEASLLRDLGYHVSIDDFGTGYSNLKLLGEVQPDVLKIDKSFVFDMEDNSLRSNLIPQMVSFARAVGAMVVAEGVENEKQERQLKDLGIEFAQGYFYSRPVPIEDFLKYLSENSA
jgi:sensor c-di-GMP phosphodiesterase-like protein